MFSRSARTRRSSTPKVTIAISTLDRCAHLERTLHSLSELTYPAFEIVVVNGPSADGTSDLLRSFEHSARIANCDVAAVGASRNIAVSMAAGELIAFLDDDAIPPPDWLEQLVPAFEDPVVAAAGGPVFDVPLGRVEWKLCTVTSLGHVGHDSEGPIERYLGPGADPVAYFAGCNLMCRRSALRAIGGFDPRLTAAYDDADVCVRLNDAGYSMAYCDAAQVRHDRAPNMNRDGQRWINDPYSFIVSRAIFLLHTRTPSDPGLPAQVLADCARDWQAHANDGLARGRLTVEQYRDFYARIDDGVRDGLALARAPRPRVKIPRAPRRSFRPYR